MNEKVYRAALESPFGARILRSFAIAGLVTPAEENYRMQKPEKSPGSYQKPQENHN